MDSEGSSTGKTQYDPLLRSQHNSDDDSDKMSNSSGSSSKVKGHDPGQGHNPGQGQSSMMNGSAQGQGQNAKVNEDQGQGQGAKGHKKSRSFSDCNVKDRTEVIFGTHLSPSGEFIGTRSSSVPPSESGESLRNGRIFISAPSSVTSSVLKKTIVLEEVAPSMTSIIDEDDNHGNHSNWRMSVDLFSARRRGKQSQDKFLPKSVRRYYKTQDQLITAFEELHLEVDDAMENAESAAKTLKTAAILAKVSFFANLLLLIGKAVAAALSGSLAVISAVIDSMVDLVSGALMWWSGHAIKQRNIYLYPQGRTKLEPLAIVILSVIMALASVQMGRESIEMIIYYATHEGGGPVFGIAAIVLCGITVVVKLVLFLLCRRVKNPSTQALAQDHRNDVLSNSVALICGYIGYRWWNFADPIGAILISLYIIVSWSMTGLEQIKMLTGHTARPDFLKKITWLALNHDPRVLLIDTVRAFHFGNNFLVEVDIVLPPEMTLLDSHDIGESLQLKIERLPEVERAFVHLDYECEHNPFSEHKQV